MRRKIQVKRKKERTKNRRTQESSSSNSQRKSLRGYNYYYTIDESGGSFEHIIVFLYCFLPMTSRGRHANFPLPFSTCSQRSDPVVEVSRRGRALSIPNSP